jgi:hypothetical protein
MVKDEVIPELKYLTMKALRVSAGKSFTHS